MNATRSASGKLDLKRELKSLYSGKVGHVKVVTPGTRPFLCVQGAGDPNTSPVYRAAVECLFTVSYTLKFTARQHQHVDYAVMPLEGLWWSDDHADFAVGGDKGRWQWTMMIMQPAFITAAQVDAAKLTAERKRGINCAALTLEMMDEGPSAQTLHVGPFSAEGPTVASVHDWIRLNGHELTGKHHEIYLSDIRRADPARWKTIIRQPFR